MRNINMLQAANAYYVVPQRLTLIHLFWHKSCYMIGVHKINIDDHADAATRYGIRSMPTLLLFKDGQLVKQYVGLRRKVVLIAAINEQL